MLGYLAIRLHDDIVRQSPKLQKRKVRCRPEVQPTSFGQLCTRPPIVASPRVDSYRLTLPFNIPPVLPPRRSPFDVLQLGHHTLNWNVQFDTVRDIKEKLCYCPTSGGEVMEDDEYELPDGNTVTLNDDCRRKAAEVKLESCDCTYVGHVPVVQTIAPSGIDQDSRMD